MVLVDPIFASWSLKKFRATIFNDIYQEVFFFSLVSTMVVLVSEFTHHKLEISNQMLTVLGTVLGLVISFRTTSAYERFQDGRKLWSNIMVASRNIAMMVWIHVPCTREDKDTKEKKPLLECVIEKKSIINLVQAFSVSVKHFLRGEQGIYYADLYPLICFLPRYAVLPPATLTKDDLLPLWDGSADGHSVFDKPTPTRMGSTTSDQSAATLSDSTNTGRLPNGEKPDNVTSHRTASSKRHKVFDPEKVLPVFASDKPLQPARSPPKPTFWDYFGFLRFLRPIIRFARGRKSGDLTVTGRVKKQIEVESNIPMEITLFLNSYLAWLLRSGLLQPAIATGLVTNISNLQDTVNNLERIRNTPLPFAYQAHLRLSLWLYLLILPFQIYQAFGRLTIPATAFASFLYLGFLEIGQQIENPFNYDENDLDLDQFCLMIQRELHEITAHSSPDPSTFIFSAWNQPFAPGDRRTAEEMIADVEHDYHKDEPGAGLDSVRRTLLQSWRDVDTLTRKKHMA